VKIDIKYRAGYIKPVFNLASYEDGQMFIHPENGGVYVKENNTYTPIWVPKHIPVLDKSVSCTNRAKREHFTRLKLYVIIRDIWIDHIKTGNTDRLVDLHGYMKSFEWMYGPLKDNTKYFKRDKLFENIKELI